MRSYSHFAPPVWKVRIFSIHWHPINKRIYSSVLVKSITFSNRMFLTNRFRKQFYIWKLHFKICLPLFHCITILNRWMEEERNREMGLYSHRVTAERIFLPISPYILFQYFVRARSRRYYYTYAVACSHWFPKRKPLIEKQHEHMHTSVYPHRDSKWKVDPSGLIELYNSIIMPELNFNNINQTEKPNREWERECERFLTKMAPVKRARRTEKGNIWFILICAAEEETIRCVIDCEMISFISQWTDCLLIGCVLCAVCVDVGMWMDMVELIVSAVLYYVRISFRPILISFQNI